MPIFLVRGVAERVRRMQGPIVLVANLLTEGRGDDRLHRRHGRRTCSRERSAGRSTSSIVNTSRPSADTLARYAQEHKAPLEIGEIPPETELVTGELWCDDIARHDRRRLAQAVWAVLARRLL